ncbi:MAG: methyltransferase domain-containing protein [Pirellulales bacterium]
MSKLSQLIGKKNSRRRSMGTHAPTWFEARRPLSPTVGTAAELYRQPEQVEAVDARFSPLLNEPATLEAIEHDTVVLPATADREGYFHDHHFAYWLSGLADLRMVQRLVPSASFAHVLDFGGASGRFARQVVLAEPSARVTVADLNVNHVEWVERHFDRSVRAVKVSPYPHFPLADGSVTLCVGLSVFTHIDPYESGWLAEIQRVLADGGYALLTIHSEQTWRLLPTQPELLRRLQRIPEFAEAFRLGEPMPPGRAVYDWNPNSIEHNCNVFMDSDYVRRRWSRWFEVVDIAHRAHHDFQAAVILRKTGGS